MPKLERLPPRSPTWSLKVQYSTILMVRSTLHKQPLYSAYCLGDIIWEPLRREVIL